MKRDNHNHPYAHTNSYVHVVDQLVVNWHLTEVCNYSCRYCYSQWEKSCRNEELLHDDSSSRRLLQDLYRFFSPENRDNPLCSRLKWSDLRLSLAGGEPLLYPQRTLSIANVAKDLGFKVSLITNASQLSQSGLEPLFGHLSILGISLDSMDADRCRQIGRTDKVGRVLSLADHVATIEKVRSANPGIDLKINTVVSKLNSHEDLTETIKRLKPNKWKILKVLPVVSNELAVTDKEFQMFVERHRHLGSLIAVETNVAMTESYLMVDPLGRFFQNKSHIETGGLYSYSQPIIQSGAAAAFREICFDVSKFAARYPSFPEEVAA
jgi:radical S-adenosyl methionine domain-containing protein 2